MRTSEESFKAFLGLKEALPKFNLNSQTESDTRARIVSRMLEDVLDWPQENISREPYANPGFMDYVLMTNKRIVVVEAKRSGDTFHLPPDISTSRDFTLGGVLRTVKNLQTYVDQVGSYCFRNGIEYAVISNGLQWIVFKAIRRDGIHIAQNRVAIFKGFDDIEARFIDFWSMLSKTQVENNSLGHYFQETDAAIFQYKRIIDELHYRREKVSRNELSFDLEPLIAEYMGEITGEGSRDKLKHLFVKSKALQDVLFAVEQRISFNLSETLLGTGRVIHAQAIDAAADGLEKKLKKHLSLPPHGEVIVLLGRVGSGKTTFVNHFLSIDLQSVFDHHILVPFDFRQLEKGTGVRKFFYENLHRILSKNKQFTALSSKELRQVYAAEIRDLTKGPLAVLERQNKKLYEQKIAEMLLQKYADTETYLTRVIRFLADKRGVRCVFVLDNVDQLDFDQQQEIFTFAHSVCANCHAFGILTMWEETYLRSSRSGVLAAYQLTAHAIPPTSVVDIIARRLEFVATELISGGLARQMIPHEEKAEDVAEFLNLVRESILHDRRRARFFLESAAMGNLRKAMSIFASFLISGHTDAGKILSIYRHQAGYLIPLHEFIKSIGLGDRRFYQSDLSFILNLYSLSDESRPSHFTKLRILTYLYFHRARTTSFGVGFLRTSVLKQEFFKIGTSEADLVESLRLLSAYSLVENDAYDPEQIAQAYRVTLAGRYYMRYLAGKFPYLDLVLQDTPVADEKTFAALEQLIDKKDLDDRFARVRAFLDYLAVEEQREYAAIASTSDSLPLRRQFMTTMIREFEEDRAYILRMVAKRRETFKGITTPYETRN